MTSIASFTCNPFEENTYIIYDETGSCVIVDPGCYTKPEKEKITTFIQQKNLSPKYLINTHCHIDHVLGNRFIFDTYTIPLMMHKGEKVVLDAVDDYAYGMGIHYQKSPEPQLFIDAGDTIEFGNTILSVILTPGHSPASISLYCEKEQFIISGDVLFFDSIGRTDLPGGNYETLLQSINNQLMTLPDHVKVFAGHMQSTTIGRERKLNPFLINE